MEKRVEGDVVVVPFPFTNLEQAKRRPAFVLAVLGDEDYIFCQITSRAWPDSVPLHTTDFTERSLPHDSYIRPKKLYTGNQTVVISRAGRPTANIQGRIHRRLLALFQALDKQSPLATPTKRHKSLE